MNQNDYNKRSCKNTQLKDQLQSATRHGDLKVRKQKRKTKTYQTLGQALAPMRGKRGNHDTNR